MYKGHNICWRSIKLVEGGENDDGLDKGIDGFLA